MKDKLIKIGFRHFLWFVKFWYGLSMFLTRTKTHVKYYKSYSGIVEAIDYGRDWRSDPLKGVLDVVTHPTRFQDRLNEATPGVKDKIGDCDDHAAYWCVALLKSGLAAKAWFSFYQMRNKTTGKVGGHVVCVFEDHQGKRKWCDYDMPTTLYPEESKFAWATQSAARFNSTVIAAGMIEVKRVSRMDSITFGKSSNSTKF